MTDSIWIGFDARWPGALAVARESALLHAPHNVTDVKGIVLDEMRQRGLYWRPTSKRGEQLWDDISEAPMATEFAISRFLTPFLAKAWDPRCKRALFMDCDVLVKGDLTLLWGVARMYPQYAVMCVKHQFAPPPGEKMGGQAQLAQVDPRAAGVYTRKNWSSVMLFNTDHPSNRKLTIELINTVPGRDLHRFCWLEDDEIGELPPSWNYLVGHTQLPEGITPDIVHYTDGIPSIPGYENCEYADDWRAQLNYWAK